MRAYLPDRSWVLRTAWLYGWHGPNFISTILRLLNERDTLDVVDDQHGQPTWTVDLANRIVDTIVQGAPPGVCHATAAGHTTWYGLAQQAVRLAGEDPQRIHRTTTPPSPGRHHALRGRCSGTTPGSRQRSPRCPGGTTH